MKKPMIVLIISVIFLTCSMFWVVYKNKEPKGNITNDMDVNYVDTNFEIELYDEFDSSNVNLTAKAKYIGNDEIIKQPEIKLDITCSYVYEDAKELFTDIVTDSIVMNKEENIYIGSKQLELNRDEIESYSCFYKIVEVNGSYIKKN